MASKAITIQGRVLNPQRQPLPNLRIEAWDNDLLVDDFVGETNSDASGNFTISFTPTRFKELFLDRRPDIYFKVFDQSKLLKSTINEAIINLAGDLNEVELILDIPAQQPNSPRPPRYNVSGTIADANGRPLPGLQVTVYNVNLRQWISLGQNVTDKQGLYSVHYTHITAGIGEKNTADIGLRISTAKGTQLYETPMDKVRFNAGLQEQINVRIAQDASSDTVEYEVLLEEVGSLAGNLSIAELQESKTHRDITFLSKELETPSERLEYLVLAQRLQERFEVEAPFWYAIFRKNTLQQPKPGQLWGARAASGIDTDDQALLYQAALTDPQTIETDVKQAVAEKIVPASVAKTLKRNLERLAAHQKEAEAYYREEFPKKAGDFITRFIQDGKIDEVQRLFAEHKNDLNTFFEKITDADFYGSTEDGSKESLVSVGKLLGMNKAILPEIAKARGINKPEDYRKLAKLNKADWVKEISSAKSAPKDKALINAYASAMTRKMEKEFPTMAFAAQLEREKKQVLPQQEKLLAFFAKHENFDLTKHNVDTYLKENKVPEADGEAVRESLKSVQRVFRLVPHYGKTKALGEKNIHSAQGIVGMGKARFMNEVAPEAGIDPKEAQEIYRKAEQRNTAAMLIVGDLQDSMSVMEIASFETAALSKKLEAVSKDFPNLKSLFKLTDTCECEHCHSVYSPAAYLVEILRFLDNRTVTDTTSSTTSNIAKDILFERRPDLGEIDLNCANATTPVKYIDLVCELLEDAIRPDSGITYTGNLSDGPEPLKGIVSANLYDALSQAGIPLSKEAVVYETETSVGSPDTLPHYLRDSKAVCKIVHVSGNKYKVYRLRQTLSTAEELDAAPEYVNANVYTNDLRQAKFAFKLPFDLNHTEAKAYLSRFDIPRADLMATFEQGGTPTPDTLAAEWLGLTKTQYELIVKTADTESEQQEFWNVPAPNTVTDYLKRVDLFLDKTGLSYKELNLLLKLRFIDPDGKLYIYHKEVSCDTEQKEIAKLDLKVLDRIHRFLRLQKLTGWKFETLDQLISQTKLGDGKLNETCLQRAAQLVQIAAKTSLKLDDLIGFYDEIPYELLTENSKPLYPQVFLNKAKNGVIDEGLLPEKVDGSQTVDTYAGSLAVCLQVKQKDLEALLPLLVDNKLSFPNLSYLFAATRLSKKLKLKTDDWIILEKLSGIHITDSPQATLDFIQTAQEFARSPLKPADAQFMLRHEAINLNDRVIQEAKVTALLEKLRDGYAEAEEEKASKFDANLSAEENKEAFIQVVSALENIAEGDVDTLLKFLDAEWTSVADAKTFLDSKLNAGIDRTGSNAAIDALDSGGVTEANQKQFIQALLDSISVFQIQQAKHAFLEQTLAETFKMDLESAQATLAYALLRQTDANPVTGLLANLLLNPFSNPIDSSNYPNQYGAVRLLQKMAAFIQAFELTDAEITWYLNNNLSIGWLALDGLPFDTAQTAIPLAAYLAFAKTVAYSKEFSAVVNPADAENPVTFFSVANLLPIAGTTQDAFLTPFALLTGHDKDELTAIDSYLHSPFAIAHYHNMDAWERLLNAAEYARKLGASMSQIKAYIQPELGTAEVADLRATLKARYDEDTWLGTLKEIMDKIRPQKRNALVGYLLATNPGIKDENDLYDIFLVDVEMESCMPSSRIVQAHNTIQLFVQRCLLGLEPRAVAEVDKDPNWEQWQWMKNYRVWEANRKVFLYPENWYDVTLADDKTFLLSEFIDELQQNELNEYTAEQALIKYLEKLDSIAFLEVMATWYDTATKNMHVFARSKGGDPCLYYYRRFEKERVWTPWEKVELDISGDHLLAFMRNNRLCLAWPMFSEETDPDQKSTVPVLKTEGDPEEAAVDKPSKKLKIQLAISEYSNKRWQAKRVSKDSISTPDEGFTFDKWLLNPQVYNLIYSQSTDQIMVFRTYWAGMDYHQLAGMFDIAGCKGYPEPATPNGSYFPDFLPDFKDAPLQTQRYRELKYRSSDNLAVTSGASPFYEYTLLAKTPGRFRITYPHQFTYIDLISFMYQLLVWVLNRLGDKQGHKRDGFKLPLGTLLPYFKEDSHHAYVIIPGFYHKVEGDKRDFYLTDAEKRTASDVFKLLEDIGNWFQKMKLEFETNPPATLAEAIQTIISDTDFQDILKEMAKYESLDFVLNLLVGNTNDEAFDEWVKGLRDSEGLVYGEQFKNMYHPLVCALRSILYNDGIPGLMKRETQLKMSAFNFKTNYIPNQHLVPMGFLKNADGTLTETFPVEDVDFNSDGSYSTYNWDLFFRVPLHIATGLTQNQRFEEALTWFHYMFNPTGALPGNGVQKYWVTKPFYMNQESDYTGQRIDALLNTVSGPDSQAKSDLEFYIEEWRTKPFRPDVVARFRPVAYQKALLMKYIDNLTEWGDYLFRQDTMESVAQATQMYILADKLLGPKPRTVQPAVKPPYETYNQLERKLDGFGNALVELENMIPDLNALPEGGNELPAPPPYTLAMHYFCIPQNEQMLAYWDRVADRLFKIRHCQNIDGVERSLALFAPPIDPGMLVRAAASGLDMSSILAGLNAPTPYYRFNILSQKATELAQEVRGLGTALLQTLEKKDGEALALLRNELEMKVLVAIKDVKKFQIDESNEQIEVLKRTQAVTQERYQYYKNIKKLIPEEELNLDKLEEANEYQFESQIVRTVAGALALIPEFHVGASGFGGSPHVVVQLGGSAISKATNIGADILNILGSIASYEANRASIKGGHNRRFDDWKLQERLADKEIKSIDKQIEAAKIRKKIAETDLRNHELQIENSKKSDAFMRSKFTNKELYTWMLGQIASVYFKSYQLAHDFAKKAERCYRFELGNDDSYISFGYWDSMKKGLSTADKLIHDIKRMETGYLDKNKREYEVTKNISLAQLDPFALVQLRTTGTCDFDIPEVLYDMDHPGQYFRRLKSVSVSLPCVAGPHTSVSAKLSLVNNRYRKNTNPDNLSATGYAEDPGNDERFMYNLGAIQSIAVSHAQNDSGMFELNFKDERYLPFEGTGAISGWRLELPTTVKQFDYNSISDVVLHVKYTAREGGSGLKMAANGSLTDLLQLMKPKLADAGLYVAINMKHEMPNEWHLLKTNGNVDLTFTKFRLPYMVQAFETTVDNLTFVAQVQGNPAGFEVKVDGGTVDLAVTAGLPLCRGTHIGVELDTAFNLSVANADKAKLEELMLLVKYSF